MTKTLYQPTPESERGKPTYNVQLAERVIKTVLEQYDLPHVISAEIIAKIHNRKDAQGKLLVEENFIPDFDGPLASVDEIIVGHGEHANDILVEEIRDPTTGQKHYRLPGMLARYGKNMKQVGGEGISKKYGIHTTPMMFMGAMQERLRDGVTLRDDRYPTIGFVYIAACSEDPYLPESTKIEVGATIGF